MNTPDKHAAALAAYTQATKEKWAATDRAEEALAALSAELKERSRALARAVDRRLRGTTFTREAAHYWPLIDHSARPMQAEALAEVRLTGHEKEGGRVELRLAFTPEQEAVALARLGRMVRS